MSERRFDELVAFYVNGTLGGDDRAWFESYLKQHPEAASEIDWYRSLQRRIHDNAPAVPATIGLAKAMTLIRGDQPTFAERFMAHFSLACIHHGIRQRRLARRTRQR